MADLGKPEEIGLLFAGFQNYRYGPEKCCLISFLIRRDSPASDQGKTQG